MSGERTCRSRLRRVLTLAGVVCLGVGAILAVTFYIEVSRYPVRPTGSVLPLSNGSVPPTRKAPMLIDASAGDLAKLVDKVAPGGTITLHAGLYTLKKPLDIGKPLTIIGVGMDKTFVKGEGRVFLVRYSAEGDFTVEGITFDNTGNELTDIMDVISGHARITRCRFTGAILHKGSLGLGIGIFGEAIAEVVDCHMDANTGCGIAYLGSEAGEARQNRCVQNGLHGIYIGEQAHPTSFEPRPLPPPRTPHQADEVWSGGSTRMSVTGRWQGGNRLEDS